MGLERNVPLQEGVQQGNQPRAARLKVPPNSARKHPF
jgi:hypothetical protein